MWGGDQLKFLWNSLWEKILESRRRWKELRLPREGTEGVGKRSESLKLNVRGSSFSGCPMDTRGTGVVSRIKNPSFRLVSAFSNPLNRLLMATCVYIHDGGCSLPRLPHSTSEASSTLTCPHPSLSPTPYSYIPTHTKIACHSSTHILLGDIVRGCSWSCRLLPRSTHTIFAGRIFSTTPDI